MLNIPSWLAARPITALDCQHLASFGEENSLKFFGELKKEHLQNCTLKKSFSPDYFKLVRIFAAYGVEFYGELSRYSLSAGPQRLLVNMPIEREESLLELQLDRSLYLYLSNLEMKNCRHLHGVDLNIVAQQVHLSPAEVKFFFSRRFIPVVDDDFAIEAFYQSDYFKDSENKCADFSTFKFLPGTIRVEDNCETLTIDRSRLATESAIHPTSSLCTKILVADDEKSGFSVLKLGLNVRATNALIRANIRTLGSLLEKKREDLLKLKNCGDDTVDHIFKVLETFLEGTTAILDDDATHDSSSVEEPLTYESHLFLDRLRTEFGSIDNSNFEEWYQTTSSFLKEKSSILPLESSSVLLKNVYELDFEPSTLNSLRLLNIHFLWQLAIMHPSELRKNFSNKQLNDVSKVIGAFEINPILMPHFRILFVISQLLNLPSVLKTALVSLCENERNLQIYLDRVFTKKTLEELGNEFALTRERVRQLESKISKKIARWFDSVYGGMRTELTTFLNATGGLFIFASFISVNSFDIQSAAILFRRLKLSVVVDESLNALLDIGQFAGMDAHNVDFISILVGDMSEILPSEKFNFSRAEIEEVLKKRLLVKCPSLMGLSTSESFSVNLAKCTDEALSRFFVALDTDLFQIRSASLQSRVLRAFQQAYPEGVLLYKYEKAVRETIMLLVPEIRNRHGRYVNMVVTSSSDIFLWGVGTYIHKDNLDLSSYSLVINEMINQCLSEFNRGIETFKVRLLFDRNEKRMTAAAIPSPQALYSLIRNAKYPRIAAPDFPQIIDAHLQKTVMPQLEQLECYVRAKGFVTRKQIVSHFCEFRGWLERELDQTLERSKEVVSIGRDLYRTISSVEADTEALKELVEQINESLTVRSRFHLNYIRARFPVLWNACTAFDCDIPAMSKLLVAQSECKFVVNRGYVREINAEEMRVADEISDWSLKRGEYFSISELQREFVEGKGYSKSSLKKAIKCSDLVSCYPDCFVHPKILLWDEDKAQLLQSVILKAADLKLSEKKAHINLDWILEQFSDELPLLPSAFEWNYHLIADFAESLDLGFVFHKTFVLKDNRFDIFDFDDLIAYIIASEFGEARVLCSEVERYLRQQEIVSIDGHLRKEELFFDGSSVESADFGTIIQLSQVGFDRYGKHL